MSDDMLNDSASPSLSGEANLQTSSSLDAASMSDDMLNDSTSPSFSREASFFDDNVQLRSCVSNDIKLSDSTGGSEDDSIISTASDSSDTTAI